MKRQKSCGPRLGKLVHQVPRVVTFAYDLCFRHMISRWKGIIEEINFGGSIMPFSIIEKLYLEKTSFRPSKWPRKLKLLKIVNFQNCQKTVLSQLEEVGGHRYPPRSLAKFYPSSNSRILLTMFRYGANFGVQELWMLSRNIS
jgi:hypothetical protein